MQTEGSLNSFKALDTPLRARVFAHLPLSDQAVMQTVSKESRVSADDLRPVDPLAAETFTRDCTLLGLARIYRDGVSPFEPQASKAIRRLHNSAEREQIAATLDRISHGNGVLHSKNREVKDRLLSLVRAHEPDVGYQGVEGPQRLRYALDPAMSAIQVRSLALTAHDPVERLVLSQRRDVKVGNLRDLARSAVDPAERRALREHPVVNDHVLGELMQKSLDKAERAALLAHEMTGPMTYASSVQHMQSDLERDAVFEHPHVSAGALRALISTSLHTSKRQLIRGHPKVDQYTIAALIGNPPSSKIAADVERLEIARDPTSSAQLLRVILYSARKGNAQERLAVIKSPNADSGILNWLASSAQNDLERSAIITHAKAGGETLDIISKTTSSREEAELIRGARRVYLRTVKYLEEKVLSDDPQ